MSFTRINENKLKISNDDNFVPHHLCGNYVRISEKLIENISNSNNKKDAKFILSIYIYLKIKLNESFNNELKTSVRKISNDLNISIGSSQKSLHILEKLNTDISISITKTETTIKQIPNLEPNIKYIPIEKNTIKELIKYDIQSTFIYLIIYSEIHRLNTISKGQISTIQFDSKRLSNILSIDKDILRKKLNLLNEKGFIKKETKRKIGNVINLTNKYIDEKHIRKETTPLNRYNEQISKNKPIYRTHFVILNRYDEHKKPPFENKKTEKPPVQKTSINKKHCTKKPVQEKVFCYANKEKEKGKNENNKEDKLSKLNAELELLENKISNLKDRFNLKPNLDGFSEIRSKYYDNKTNIYKAFYKENHNSLKIYVQYGSNLIDIDNYISDIRNLSKKGDNSYITCKEGWKKAFIRDFNKRQSINFPSNYELRIRNYIREYEIETQERIPFQIKSLINQINELSKLNDIIREKVNIDPNMQKIDKIKNFENCYPKEYEKIKDKLITKINQFRLDISKDYFITMLLNRIDSFLKFNENIEKTNIISKTYDKIGEELAYEILKY